MYKRRARVLFLEAGDGSTARWAQALATRHGRGWLRPAAATLGTGRPDTRLAWLASERGLMVDLRSCPLAVPPSEDADLIVALGLEAAAVRAWLGPRPIKAWPLPGRVVGIADWRARGDYLAARLHGLVGGLRMLARFG